MNDSLLLAHKRSSLHRDEISSSNLCGCFYCLETFHSSDISDWTDNGQTALCPFCHIDSVIGDASGIKIDKEFLKSMKKFWF